MPKEKSIISTMKKQNNYEILEFTPLRVDGKRVAICNYCKYKLTNTGYNRLKKHRLGCVMTPKEDLKDTMTEIKIEETEDEPATMQFEEQSTENGSMTSDTKIFDEEFEDPVSLEDKLEQNFSIEESVDLTFLKSMLSLMRELPVDVKDDFQATMYQRVYKLRAQARKNRMSQC